MDSAEVLQKSSLSYSNGNCIYKIHLQDLFSMESRNVNLSGSPLRVSTEAGFPQPRINQCSLPPPSQLHRWLGGGVEGEVALRAPLSGWTRGPVVAKSLSLSPRSSACSRVGDCQHAMNLRKDDHIWRNTACSLAVSPIRVPSFLLSSCE